MSNITKLLQSGNTVFTFQEIKDILGIPTHTGVKSYLQRAKKNGSLLNPRKGVRTLPFYHMYELAGKLFPEGYISLEPVLFAAGVSYQFYGTTVQCVRHKNADIVFNNQNYTAKVIKKSLRDNQLCIQEFDGYRKAMPERALCDLVYLRPQAHFDNPQYFQNPQSKARLAKLLPLYPQTVQSYVEELLVREI